MADRTIGRPMKNAAPRGDVVLHHRPDNPTSPPKPANGARESLSGSLNPTPGPPAPSGAVSAGSTAPQALPTRRQLLHLLDRAQRHALTPGEARLLRAGVGQLLDAAEQPVAVPVVSLEQLRAVLLAWAEDFAPDVPVKQVEWLARQVAGLFPKPVAVRPLTSKPRAAADDARVIAARLERTVLSPLEVACPQCSARPAERCRAVRGTVAPREPHAARVRTAGGGSR